MGRHLHPVVDVDRVDLDAYREYLASLGLKPKTRAQYVRHLGWVDDWCRTRGMSVAAASPGVIAEYCFGTPASSSNRRHLRSALGHYWAMVGRVDAPTRAIRVPPKPRGRCRAVTVAEARALEAASLEVGYPKGTAVLAGLFLALRISEIASMHWQRFDGDEYVVTGKGDVTAAIAVPQPFTDHLASVVGDIGYVFPGSRGRAHVTPATVWNWTQTVSTAAGLGPMQPHRLRHTAIATINDVTGDLRAAQEFARHARPETTAIYTRVTAERMRAAAAALRYH